MNPLKTMNKKKLFILLTLSLVLAFVVMFFNAKRPVATKDLSLYQQKANNNDPTAQYYLGQMYRQGNGVAKNMANAVHWYHQAAEQGNVLAQYNLGWMYDVGDEIEPNVEKMLKWYRQAAEKGNQHAAFNLGARYYSGDGVTKDFIKTYYWFDLAMNNGNIKAKKWRDKISKRMTLEQIKQAKVMLQQRKNVN